MRIQADFIGIYPYQQTPEVYQELCDILYPDGNVPPRAFLDIPVEEPRLLLLIACLQRHGWTPWSGLGHQKPTEYTLYLRRYYDTQDYENAAFLRPNPECHYKEAYRQENGAFRVEELPKKAHEIGGSGGGAIMVFDRIKRLMEEELRHVLFAPVELAAKASRKIAGPVWELTSGLILPSLAPPNYLVTDADQPFTGSYESYESGCLLREELSAPESLFLPPQSLYMTSELYFRRADIEALEPFDLAKTKGKFGLSSDGPCLVASAKFYRFCLKHQLPMRWRPVWLTE